MRAILSQLRADLAALGMMVLSALAHPCAFLADLLGWA
jgi:hypothetical protein